MTEFAAVFATAHGRVQGVSFRAFVEYRARELGVTGYVRNLPEFRQLEVYAEGEKGKLEELLRLVSAGPPRARVERVDVTWSPYSGRHRHFVVRF